MERLLHRLIELCCISELTLTIRVPNKPFSQGWQDMLASTLFLNYSGCFQYLVSNSRSDTKESNHFKTFCVKTSAYSILAYAWVLTKLLTHFVDVLFVLLRAILNIETKNCINNNCIKNYKTLLLSQDLSHRPWRKDGI